MQDFSLIFTADLKHVTMVFSKILPQNQLNSDTDLSVQRKPTFGSSLFGIASFDTIRRNWESLCSFETIFNCGNFICKYYGMFSIFSGCFQQRYTNYIITSKHFESFVFFMGYKYEPLLMERFSTHCCLIPVFSTPRNTYGCRADEPNHFVYVSWFVSIVKWKRKWIGVTNIFILKGTTSLSAEYKVACVLRWGMQCL